ncbi:signal recognition particle-docking protein FtsY [Metamycoplasma cloacale]|uniref:Signal recognition particle receptor FtsY n=1 Tax=Metamycoplasma cloacale TaxID=92401 RepID=A0A2Z4LLI3_9BACT|nr:signal recognition particle-docking protein FtsY [Metamycoplasma cloacale]AWX42540.1 signal recognition particle-docking protein FtsY [Metamycoplasma cloacale]VEU79114.1 signal recognition particle-docking protein FtsY [Metamycoplasma cloacale]VEU79792.1 signal recognition particle-docking protein FtsY [Metamycoplasma cloacale]
MGFWKSLKEKLFGTEEEQLAKKKRKEEIKQQKKLEKELKKASKLNTYVAGMSKSNIAFVDSIKTLQNRHNKIDEEFFEDLEEILIMSDISIKLVNIIIEECKNEVKNENIVDPKLINEIIADKLFSVYANDSIIDTTLNIDNEGVNVILVVGVNGSGKTTSISKIAKMLINEGKKVLIAAADTFRAAAVEQLEFWANKVGADIVKPLPSEKDPAAVVYKAIDKAEAENYDVLIVDTAGRLQNKVNLMQELAKINKVLQTRIPNAPHESLLVLDGTTGQNGVLQAKSFFESTPLTGIVLTKMDGTSKGGIILTIKDELNLSVKFIGLGEKVEDLAEFDLASYIYGLTKGLDNNE